MPDMLNNLINSKTLHIYLITNPILGDDKFDQHKVFNVSISFSNVKSNAL